MKLFQGTGTGCLTLRRRFLNRYASVQSYEERRRKEAVANGEQPGLGQLEYGNVDIKIALQASKTIEAHHIRTLQDLSAIGMVRVPPGSQERMANPVLIFGSFKEPYEPASVPVKPAAAYKRPLRWSLTGPDEELEVFANKHLNLLQPAGGNH